jgi:leucine dehydrogenase
MTVIREVTAHVAGLSREEGGSGDPSPFTARGVEIAIRSVLQRLFGSPSLQGRGVSIIGLGHVGEQVAHLCADDGAQLVLADVDPDKAALADELGGRWVSPQEALVAEVDVLSPCALGGVLNPDSVPALRCRGIAGAANNQLADDSVAELLHRRGILYAPDFVANAGGIINIACERDGYDPELAARRVQTIADNLELIFDASARDGVSPLSAALALARTRLEPPASEQPKA